MSYLNITSSLNSIQTGITEIKKHVHPQIIRCIPNGSSRIAAAHFTGVANNQNYVLGNITYIFVTILGSPNANQVHVKIQTNLSDTIILLAKAIRGEIDISNIAYGSGTTYNTIALGWYTRNTIGIGAGATDGDNLYLEETALENTSSITHTTTATATLIAFARFFDYTYRFTNNSLSIASPIYTIVPLYYNPVPYENISIVVDSVSSANTTKEVDVLSSTNEISNITGSIALGSNILTIDNPLSLPLPALGFFPDQMVIINGVTGLKRIIGFNMPANQLILNNASDATVNNVRTICYVYLIKGMGTSKDSLNAGSQQFTLGTVSVPPNSGVYVQFRSSGSSNAETIDFKIQYQIDSIT